MPVCVDILYLLFVVVMVVLMVFTVIVVVEGVVVVVVVLVVAEVLLVVLELAVLVVVSLSLWTDCNKCLTFAFVQYFPKATIQTIDIFFDLCIYKAPTNENTTATNLPQPPPSLLKQAPLP